jgi:hypothetical protein
MTTYTTPRSRTKCALKGPVSGTAAGSPRYQARGAASIHAPFASVMSPAIV